MAGKNSQLRRSGGLNAAGVSFPAWTPHRVARIPHGSFIAGQMKLRQISNRRPSDVVGQLSPWGTFGLLPWRLWRRLRSLPRNLPLFLWPGGDTLKRVPKENPFCPKSASPRSNRIIGKRWRRGAWAGHVAVDAPTLIQLARLRSGRGAPGAAGFWDGLKASWRLPRARFLATVAPDSEAAAGDTLVGAAIGCSIRSNRS